MDTDDLLDVTETDQLRALGHPARMRLLLSVGADGATVSQLATRLGTNKGNVAHHLAVLERAGLVRRGRTRTVRGGTEQYFERVARRLRTPGRRGIRAHRGHARRPSPTRWTPLPATRCCTCGGCG